MGCQRLVPNHLVHRMNFILFNVWTPSEMANLQAQMLANAKALDGSLAKCSIDATTKTNWKTFFDQLSAFAQQKPQWLAPVGSDEVATTGTRADLLQNYQAELAAWQRLLGGKCNLSLPDFAPPVTAGTPQSLKYIAIGAGFIASAWMAHEIVKG